MVNKKKKIELESAKWIWCANRALPTVKLGHVEECSGDHYSFTLEKIKNAKN